MPIFAGHANATALDHAVREKIAGMALPYTMTSVGGTTHSYNNDSNIAAIGSNYIGDRRDPW